MTVAPYYHKVTILTLRYFWAIGTNINLGTLGTISRDIGPFFLGHWAIFENVRKFYWTSSAGQLKLYKVEIQHSVYYLSKQTKPGLPICTCKVLLDFLDIIVYLTLHKLIRVTYKAFHRNIKEQCDQSFRTLDSSAEKQYLDSDYIIPIISPNPSHFCSN